MISVLYNICSIIPVSSLLSALHDPSDGDNTAVRRRRDLNAGPLRTGVDDLTVADVDTHMSQPDCPGDDDEGSLKGGL